MFATAALFLALQAHLPLDPLLPSTPAEDRKAAFTAIAASEDPRYVPPLLDLLAQARTREEWFLILDTLTPLTGRDMRQVDRPWRTLSTELARGPAPEGRAEAWAFKGKLFAEQIDPDFAGFFTGEPPLELRVDQVAHGGVDVGGIPALTDPKTQGAKDATWLPEGAAVVGLSLGGEARAYPLAIIDWHEMVNDVVGDVPVALTWCTLCGAAIPYRAERDGKRLVFGSSGLLHRSNKLMFDEETRSLWTQLTGRPVAGERAGEDPLELLPVRVTTWGQWRTDHPTTTVITSATGYDRPYREGAAYGDYFSAAPTMFAVAHDEGRGAPKQVMVVVPTETGTFTVPAAAVEDQGGLLVRRGGTTYTLTSTWRPGTLPAAWSEALGESPITLDALGAAADRAVEAGEPLSPLGLDDLAALPRPVRREVIADESGRIPVLELARRTAASRQLAADIVVHAAGERTVTWKDGAWVTDKGQRFELLAGALAAKDGAHLQRVPSHLAFRFAAPDGDAAR